MQARCTYIVLLVTALFMTCVPAVSGQSIDEGDDDFNKGARTSLQFLKIGIGARQAALGEASIATVRDVNAVFWNPANITGVESVETAFSYIRWIADMNYVAGAAGVRWGNIGVFALSVAALDYGDIPEALVTSPTGDNDTRTGNSFSGNDLLVGLAYSREFTDRLSIGLNAKLIREELFEYSASTLAFDVGTNYDLRRKGVRLAMSVQNFGGSVKYLDESSRLEDFDIPLVFRIGLSFNVFSSTQDAFATVGGSHDLRVSVEAINTNDFSERFHVGGEYWFSDFLALRGGYRINYAEGNLALGFGVNPTLSGLDLRIDYAYVRYEFLDAPHRFTMTLAF